MMCVKYLYFVGIISVFDNSLMFYVYKSIMKVSTFAYVMSWGVHILSH